MTPQQMLEKLEELKRASAQLRSNAKAESERSQWAIAILELEKLKAEVNGLIRQGVAVAQQAWKTIESAVAGLWERIWN